MKILELHEETFETSYENTITIYEGSYKKLSFEEYVLSYKKFIMTYEESTGGTSES